MNVWNIKTTSINVERTINATPAEVFDAWLDPNSEGSPWNGVTKAILQPKGVGGDRALCGTPGCDPSRHPARESPGR